MLSDIRFRLVIVLINIVYLRNYRNVLKCSRESKCFITVPKNHECHTTSLLVIIRNKSDSFSKAKYRFLINFMVGRRTYIELVNLSLWRETLKCMQASTLYERVSGQVYLYNNNPFVLQGKMIKLTQRVFKEGAL